MKKLCSLFLALSLCIFSFAQTPVDLVNTLMGTDSRFDFSNGNTYPAVAVPWGMNFWTPQTGENGNGWIYSYADTKIRGFRQTHQPSPWINDYGTFSIMPLSGQLLITNKERSTGFSHEQEIATPYYYAVTLEDKTFVEFAPSNRGAIFNIRFAPGKSQYLIIDAYNKGSRISINKKNGTISGYTKSNSGGVPDNFANYFVIQFNAQIINCGTNTNGITEHGDTLAEHDAVCAYLHFDIPTDSVLTIRIASSFISEEQAWNNLNSEIADRSFEQIKQESKKLWNEYLSRIKIEGKNQEQQRIFYSCLYRTLLFPRAFFEYDKQQQPIYYSPYDGKIHSGYLYTDNGFWDTFRAVHPLFTLLYPEISERMIPSLLAAYDQSGFLPEWCSPGHRNCMIGNNSLSIIADAWTKGIFKKDSTKILEAMLHQTQAQGRETSVGRNGFEAYQRLGYVPYPDYAEATAKTLEYAYADWCLARVAESIGKTNISDSYYKMAQNYRHLFDTKIGFMRAKNSRGEWIKPFDATEWGGPFTEGCSWHYTWSVFHDIEGLSQLMGGHKQMALRIDSLFRAPNTFSYGTYGFVIHEIAEMVALDMGQYAHGNQPIQHLVYLYDYLQQPWKTQQKVREIMNRVYNSSPKGYCGDEDNGQTSAWYVFSAIGMYPVCPGTSQYVLGSPLFDKITLTFANKRQFTITAADNSSNNVFIQQAQLNGKQFNRNYLTHEEITQGGRFDLKMGKKPNTKRGTSPHDVPYSQSLQ